LNEFQKDAEVITRTSEGIRKIRMYKICGEVICWCGSTN
jgi:hypothetical protein